MLPNDLGDPDLDRVAELLARLDSEVPEVGSARLNLLQRLREERVRHALIIQAIYYEALCEIAGAQAPPVPAPSPNRPPARLSLAP